MSVNKNTKMLKAAIKISNLAKEFRRKLLAQEYGPFDPNDPEGSIGMEGECEEGSIEELWSGATGEFDEIYEIAEAAGCDNSPVDFQNSIVNTIFGLEWDNNNFIYPLDDLEPATILEAMKEYMYDDD